MVKVPQWAMSQIRANIANGIDNEYNYIRVDGTITQVTSDSTILYDNITNLTIQDSKGISKQIRFHKELDQCCVGQEVSYDLLATRRYDSIKREERLYFLNSPSAEFKKIVVYYNEKIQEKKDLANIANALGL